MKIYMITYSELKLIWDAVQSSVLLGTFLKLLVFSVPKILYVSNMKKKTELIK